MRTVAILKTLFFIGTTILLVGCLSKSDQVLPKTLENNMNEKESSPKISLSGKAYLKNDKLIVEYSIQNDLPFSIYVFDEMIAYDDNASPKIDRDGAYCFWEEPNTLRLVRATLRIPLEKDVYSLEIPYARELTAKSAINGKIELEIPVKEKSPFYAAPNDPEAEDSNSKVIECEKIRLIICWTESREGVEISETDVGGEQVLRIRGRWIPHLIEKNFDLPVEVLTHTDTFDRQMPRQSEEN